MAFTAVRIRDSDGRPAGTAVIVKPEASTSVLATLAAQSDRQHLERMRSGAKLVAVPRRSCSRTWSPPPRSPGGHFSLGRRMARAADQSIIDAGGLVDRHVGDGVVAFFLAETVGSQSGVARACIEAATAIRQAMVEVATRSELDPENLTMRFGLHWGSTLYVGQIATSGRMEVTPSEMRSMRRRASRRALPADGFSHRRIWSSTSTTQMRRRSVFAPSASPMLLSRTCRQRPRRLAATRPRSRSASCS